MKEQRSYFSRALVILMAVMLIFTMMPSMAFAVDDPDASNATPAATYQVYTGSVIAAPIHDASTTDAIADDALATYYGVSYKTTAATESASATATATVAALDLQSFKLTAEGTSGKWVGLAIEVPTETVYTDIQIGTDPDTLASTGKTKADYTTNNKSYVTYYWDMNTPISNLYFSFDGGTTKYAISVQTAKDCNIYVGDNSYTGKENFVLGTTYQMTAYVCQDWGSYYPCQWNTMYLSGLGIDDTAADATWGYGASVEFTPTKTGKYSLSLTDATGATIKSLTLNVVANDLRGLASGSLDFYYDKTYSSEYSMLGNNWYSGRELATTKDESIDSLKTDYKYLSACTTIPTGKTYDKMSVDWYYSDTYSPTGAGYTKVSTGGKATGTAGTGNQITYYNGKGEYDDSAWFYFNIYPDVTKAGMYYYYVVISDGTNTITSISNQAVVTVSLPKGDLSGITDGVDNCLGFYSSGGYEYSMLGNNWYAGNELKANVNAKAAEMQKDYLYLSACTTVPSEKSYTDMSVDWYYGNTYSATGAGYTKVSTGGAESGTAGTAEQITYYNGKNNYNGDYFFFNIYPDVRTAGTYYYYAEISYTDGQSQEHKISSKDCQAMVVIAEKQYTESLKGNITVDFTLNGYGSFPGISKTSVTVKNGSSVGDVFKKVLDNNGYTYQGLEDAYISSITSKSGVSLTHFDSGKNSGWMYLVNDIAPNYTLNSYILSNGDDIVWYYTGDYTKDKYAKSSMSTTDTQSVTTDANSDATSATADVKVTEQTAADGTKEKVATVTVSSSNQKEILKQAKASKSKEIVLNVSKSAAGDATREEVTLDKSFVNSIVNDTDAKLTIKTPLGDKTYTQDELKTLAAAATGSTVVLTIEKSATDDTANVEKATSGAEKAYAKARSVKTKSGVKVTYKPNTDTQNYIDEMKDLGYTVKYRFYRSTKKSSDYKAMLTKTSKTYTNTTGKAGTRYYYKVQVRIYDKDGKLIAKTALKQCKYATRVW